MTSSDKPAHDRVPPHNFEAEQALLGAIMTSNRALERVDEFLRPEHFADPTHGRIYAACLTLTGRNQLATPVTLKTYLGQDEGLKELGGDAYLLSLARAAASIINAEDYGKLLFDLALRRELIGVGEDIVNDAFEPDMEVAAIDQIERAEEVLFQLGTTGRVGGGFTSFRDSLIYTLEKTEAAHLRNGPLAGVPTGFRDLDQRLGGLHRSDLIVLAGAPSMGTTTLAATIALNAARDLHQRASDAKDQVPIETTVAFFSLSASKDKVINKILASQVGVSSDKIRDGELSHEDFSRLILTTQEMHSLPLYFDDSSRVTIPALRRRIRRLKRTRGLRLVVIDYLQLLLPAPERRYDNRVQEVSDLTRQLKAIAMEFDVSVLVVSDVSRAGEQREDRRPRLSDLRDSGEIEKIADVVTFLFREQYYLERGEPGRKPDESEDWFNRRYDDWRKRLNDVTHTAEVIIAKQSAGSTASVRLFFDAQFSRFGDLDNWPSGEWAAE